MTPLTTLTPTATAVLYDAKTSDPPVTPCTTLPVHDVITPTSSLSFIELLNDNSNMGLMGHPGVAVGNYIIVLYKGEKSPGVITKVNGDTTIVVKCLHKVQLPGSIWKWPARIDVETYALTPLSDVVQMINTPQVKPGGARNVMFLVPELDDVWK